MTASSTRSQSSVIPCLSYRDAPAAIAWLCENFGFHAQLVVPGDNNTIRHAQLTHGGGMIMVGSAGKGGEYDKLLVQPDEINGAQTQTIAMAVTDPDQVYQRVKAAGAEILIDIVDEPYGGRGFTCRDLEGHVWTIGSYDPWQEHGS